MLLKGNLQPTDFADSECRVSGWVDYPHHGARAYRVWECRCSAYWFQRHEWQVDGRNQSRMDDWIFSGYWPRRAFAAHMQPAPKDDDL